MSGEIVTGKAVPDAVDDAAKRAIQTFQQFGAKGA
jgi:hypothetical protein